MIMSKLLIDLEWSVFWYSMVDSLRPMDFIHGLIKSAVFGLAIALTSCYFGISVRGGAVGVGRAVNAAVVMAATSIMLLDFFVTYLLE
jgi:phospholipid/cholesterol/gamma-HCH transport system permease protein